MLEGHPRRAPTFLYWKRGGISTAKDLASWERRVLKIQSISCSFSWTGEIRRLKLVELVLRRVFLFELFVLFDIRAPNALDLSLEFRDLKHGQGR